MQISVAAFKKKEGKFYQAFRISDVNWCKLTEGKVTATPIFKIITRGIKECCPRLVEKCPHFGLYVLHMKFHSSVARIFPAGIYKFVVDMYDVIDPRIVHLYFIMESSD